MVEWFLNNFVVFKKFINLSHKSLITQNPPFWMFITSWSKHVLFQATSTHCINNVRFYLTFSGLSKKHFVRNPSVDLTTKFPCTKLENNFLKTYSKYPHNSRSREVKVILVDFFGIFGAVKSRPSWKYLIYWAFL